jgi:hypothetical protein
MKESLVENTAVPVAARDYMQALIKKRGENYAEGLTVAVGLIARIMGQVRDSQGLDVGEMIDVLWLANHEVEREEAISKGGRVEPGEEHLTQLYDELMDAHRATNPEEDWETRDNKVRKQIRKHLYGEE